MRAIVEAFGLIVFFICLAWVFGIVDCSCGARRNGDPSVTITLVRSLR